MLATIQFRNLLSSHLLSKNIKIRRYKIIILPVVLYGFRTWSLTLREEYKHESISEQGAEEIIWTEGDEIMEKTA
jgi:hypothetical protein